MKYKNTFFIVFLLILCCNYNDDIWWRRYEVTQNNLESTVFIIKEFVKCNNYLPQSQNEIEVFFNIDYEKRKDFWLNNKFLVFPEDPYVINAGPAESKISYIRISEDKCIVYSIGPDLVDSKGKICAHMSSYLDLDVKGDLILEIKWDGNNLHYNKCNYQIVPSSPGAPGALSEE
jgi:hypothetical protein